jgi:ACT domain-containing protein
MRAVVAVIGKDTVGILAKVSGICAEHNANVMDVTQTIMQDLFAMTMMIEISKLNIDYIDFADKLTKQRYGTSGARYARGYLQRNAQNIKPSKKSLK